MRKSTTALALALLAMSATAFAAVVQPLVIARRGEAAAYAIVVPKDASPSVAYAAEELRDFAERATGVRLSIVSDSAPLPQKAVFVGETRATADLLEKAGLPKGRDVGTDGFRIVSCPPHLLVLGSSERGALYGVYEVLEKYAGCRWYSSWHTVVPPRDEIAVPAALDDVQTPAFDMREPYWYDVVSHGEFAARLRVNARSWRRNEAKFGGEPYRFGGGLGSCHTFEALVPVAKYGKTHPEYFALRDGVRQVNPKGSPQWYVQLCLTNPDVFRIVVDGVLERIRKDPGAKYYGVSQNDNQRYCQCEKCAAVDKEEESHAGTMVRFVNAVAEAVEKEFPGVTIETLAYQYTRKPPKKTRLRHNVVPCLCTIECDFARPIDVSGFPQNVAFRKDIEGWKGQTDQLYVWDYVTDFAHYVLPFPNVHALQGNVQFFRRNNVKALFEQGAYQGRHADFAELKGWLLAKWMWNPDQPLEPLLDDFFAGYYGAGAPYVREYFDEVHRLQLAHSSSTNNPLRIFDGVVNPALSDAFLEKAAGLWSAAAMATRDDPATSYNVRMGAFTVDYARLERGRRRGGGRLLWLTDNPRFVSEFRQAQGLARSLLARMDEAKDVRLSESVERHDALVREWKELAAREIPGGNGVKTSGEVEERHLSLGRRGMWGDLVDDPAASDGKAMKLFNTHYEWCTTFSMSKVAFEPGAKYKVRVRARVEKSGNGEAFWAGVYDAKARRGRGEIAPRTSDVKDGYAWYDVCTWVPNDDEYFWIGPGRFDLKNGAKSNIAGLWIDKIEFSKAK